MCQLITSSISDIRTGKLTALCVRSLYDSGTHKHNAVGGHCGVNRPTENNLRGGKGSDMFLDEIHRKREAIARLGQQYGARRLRVFGSVARREERVDSDVDFLVDFPRGYDLFAQRLPLAEKLADLLQRPVELIPEHELNRHIRDRIMQEAVDL